jgi:5'-3' exonuclease
MGLLIDNLSKLYLPYRMRLDEEEAKAKVRERLAKRARMAKNKSAPDATLPIKRAKRHQPSPVAATPAALSTKKVAKKDGLPSEEEEDESEEVDDDDVMEQEWDINTFDTQKLVMGEDDKKYLESF